MSHKATIEAVCSILDGNTFHPATTCTAKPCTPAQLTRDERFHRRTAFHELFNGHGVYTDGTMYFTAKGALRTALVKLCTAEDKSVADKLLHQLKSTKRPSQRVHVIGESAEAYLLGDKHGEPVCAVGKTKFASILKWADGVDATTDIYADSATTPVAFGNNLAVLMPMNINAKYANKVTPAQSLSDKYQVSNVATIEFGKYKTVNKRKTSTAVIRVNGLSVSVSIDVRDGDYCAWLPYGGGSTSICLIERSSRKDIEATLTELARYVSAVEYVGERSVVAVPVFLPLGSKAVEPVGSKAVEPVGPQTPVENYADYFTANERKFYEDNQPARLAAILADNPRHFVQYYQTWINKGNDFVADVLAKSPELFQRIYEGLLHPDNKASRALFTATTGVTLPATVKGTVEAVASWGGAELSAWQAAKQLEYEAAKSAKLASEQAAEREAVATVRENFTSNKFVSGADFVLLAKSLGIEPHPRTIGTILKRVDGIQISGSLQLRGRGKTSDGLTQLFHTVKQALTVEPEAVEPEAVEPEAVEPEAVEPEAVEPEAVEPEAVEPEAGSLKTIATTAPLQDWTERVSFTDDSLTVFVKRAPIGWATQLDKHYLSRGLVVTSQTIDSRTYTRADRLDAHATQSAQFPGAYPIGQAVRMSASALRSSRDYWQSQGRQPQKDRAHDAYKANLAKRGTVVDVLRNGYKVEWDDGSTSSCLTYMVDRADSAVFGKPAHATQSAQ
jgi:hypothetical protein